MASSRRRKSSRAVAFDLHAVGRVQAKLPDAETVERAALINGALADRSRLLMLFALSEVGELCVSDLAHVSGISMPAASTHLRILRAGGLVRRRSDGRMIYYAIGDKLAAQLARRSLAPRT